MIRPDRLGPGGGPTGTCSARETLRELAGGRSARCARETTACGCADTAADPLRSACWRLATTRRRSWKPSTTVPAEPGDAVLRPHAEQEHRAELAALAARRRPAAAAELAALAVGGRDLPAGRHARRRHRDHAEVHRHAPADRDRGRHAGDRPRAAAARRAGHGQDAGCPSTWPRRSAATRRCSCRARPAPPRRRSATAGTTRGCSPRARPGTALVPSPVMRAMRDGKIARVEELTRIPSDVQDALITILSEKTLPIPELDDEVQARPGLQRHRHRQQPRPRRQRALVSALRRRFNTVVLPLPATAERGGRDRRRAASPSSAARSSCRPSRRRWRRSAASSRSSASCAPGVTEDGKTKLKSPSGTLSTAEAISVVTSGLALAAHFGDGALRPADVAAGLIGAVVKDPVAGPRGLAGVPGDGRQGARRLEGPLPRLPRRRRMTPITVFGIRHHGPGSAAVGAGARWTGCSPTSCWSRARRTPTTLIALAARRGHAAAGRAARLRAGRAARARRSTRSRVFSPEWQAIRYALERGRPGAVHATCRRRISSPLEAPGRRAARPRRRADPLRRTRPPRPGTTTPSAGGRTWSSSVRRARGLRRASPRRWPSLREADAGEAMTPGRRDAAARRTCARRSARRSRTGLERIAVVCGAWHAPALRAMPVRRPPTTRAAERPAEGRRSRRPGCRGPTAGWRCASGYGAGVDSPGWYDHLFAAPGQPVARWLTRVAARCCAPRASTPRPRTSSRRCGWPRRWRRCAAGRWPAWTS